MRPPRRQIIKTRSQRPYVIARIVIVLVVAAIVALAVWWSLHRAPAHALAFAIAAPASMSHESQPSVALSVSRQEAHRTGRMPPVLVLVERCRS